MVEKMPWGTRERLSDGWWIDSTTNHPWAEGNGIAKREKEEVYYCRICGLLFEGTMTPLVFRLDSHESFRCEPCARKGGIIW